MNQYFPDVWRTYRDAGHTVLPLPELAKSSPPAGYTGHHGDTPTTDQYKEWANRFPRGNVAFRPADGLIGFDIDTYTSGDKVKDGRKEWDDLCTKLGDPGTTIVSTARDPKVSGIRWYRTPLGLKWPGKIGDAIEVVQHVHRYAVVWPSEHPEIRKPYTWYDPEFRPLTGPPDPASFTDLPEAWVRHITAGQIYVRPDVLDMGVGEVEEWAEERPQGDPCREMQAQLDRTVDSIAESGAYESARGGVWALLNLAADGHSGLVPALEQVGMTYYTEASSRRDPGKVQGEWERMVRDGVKKVAAGEMSTHCWCSWKMKPQAEAKQVAANQFVSSDGRKLTLTRVSDIVMKRALWLWKDRIAMGTLALVAGQPGMGKSTLVYWLAAQLTNGQLYGEFSGKKKDVLVCATEDDFNVTIKPRLVAAGADTDRVFRMEISSRDDIMDGLNLMSDLNLIKEACEVLDVGLLILDPLMSRIGDRDSHKDAEVRQALEPLTSLARECNFGVVGLMHFNKSGKTDPLSLLMGSAAFAAVARSVHVVMPDPEDETYQRRLFGTEKNNMGPKSGPGPHDLDTWTFTLESVSLPAEDGDTQPLITSKLVWGDDSEKTIEEALIAKAALVKAEGKAPKKETKYEAAVGWLETLFLKNDGPMHKADVIDAAKRDMLSDHSEPNLQRAIKDDRFDTRRVREDGKTVALWGLKGSFE